MPALGRTGAEPAGRTRRSQRHLRALGSHKQLAPSHCNSRLSWHTCIARDWRWKRSLVDDHKVHSARCQQPVEALSLEFVASSQKQPSTATYDGRLSSKQANLRLASPTRRIGAVRSALDACTRVQAAWPRDSESVQLRKHQTQQRSIAVAAAAHAAASAQGGIAPLPRLCRCRKLGDKWRAARL